jgi:hypothetical protein
MSRLIRRLVILLSVLVVFASLALAARGQTPAKAPEATREEAVPEKGVKSRVFEVKYRDPVLLQNVLKPLGSGSPGAQLSASRDFSTISVRDFPENIAVIEEALKRLDRPEAAAPDVELRLHVLVGSNSESDATPAPELKDTIAALKSTLAYRHYAPVGVFVQRVKDRTRRVEGSGSSGALDLPGPKGEMRTATMNYSIDAVGIDSPPSGPALVRLEGFAFVVVGPSGRLASLRTDLSLKEGETVVVGTSALRDKSLIVVLSAKVVR